MCFWFSGQGSSAPDQVLLQSIIEMWLQRFCPFTWTSPGGSPDSQGLNGLSPVQPTAAWQCSLLHDSPWPSASLRYHAESQRCLLVAEVQARVRVCDTVNLHRWRAAASKVSPPLARTPYTWDLRVNEAQWVGDWNKRLWPPAALTSAVSTQLTPYPPPPNKPPSNRR